MENLAKQNFKMSLEFVEDLFKKSSLSKRYSINASTNKVWSLSSGFVDERSISAAARPLNEAEVKDLAEIYEKVKRQFDKDSIIYKSFEDFEINQGLSKGDEFPHYTKLNDVLTKTETELKHQEGEVILLDVWATWCGPCQRPMQHNQDMLVKNDEKWNGKVRIVAVSVDDENDDVLKRIEDKKWDKITHLRLNGWDGEHPIIKDYKIRGIPFVALVDTKGLINYSGHPSSVDLEERINELLEGKGNGEEKASSQMNSEKYKQAKKLLKNQLPEYKKSQNEKDVDFTFRISLDKVSTITPLSQEKSYNSLEYSVVVNKKLEKNYHNLKNYVVSALGEAFPLKKSKEQIVDIKGGIAADFKELAKIYEKHNLQQLENQHCVAMTLTLQNNKLVYDKDEYMNQHKKIFIEKDANKSHVEDAQKEQSEFAINKYQSGQYADYLRKAYEKGIKTTDVKLEIPQSHEDSYRKVKDLLQDKELLDLELTHNLGYNPKFKIVLKRHRVFNYKGEMKRKYYDKAVIKYNVRTCDIEAFKKDVLDKVFAKLDKNLVNVKEELIKTASIEEGKNCKSCNCELVVPYYFNFFQKEHYCIACGDKRDETIKTIKQFAVPHNLVLITTTDKDILSNVDEYKLGKDVQPEAENEIQQEFEYGCNGCEEGGKTDRYVCLSCRPGPYQASGFVDFCSECLKKQVFDKDEDFMNLIQKSEPKHNFNHVYLKIRTSIGGYRNY